MCEMERKKRKENELVVVRVFVYKGFGLDK